MRDMSPCCTQAVYRALRSLYAYADVADTATATTLRTCARREIMVRRGDGQRCSFQQTGIPR